MADVAAPRSSANEIARTDRIPEGIGTDRPVLQRAGTTATAAAPLRGTKIATIEWRRGVRRARRTRTTVSPADRNVWLPAPITFARRSSPTRTLRRPQRSRPPAVPATTVRQEVPASAARVWTRTDDVRRPRLSQRPIWLARRSAFTFTTGLAATPAVGAGGGGGSGFGVTGAGGAGVEAGELGIPPPKAAR